MIYAGRSTNTVNIVKKFVTIFAGNLDNFIVTNNQLKLLKTTVTSGSGQITIQMTIYRFAGLLQKLRHTRRAPGPFPGPNGTSYWPVAAPGNIS
jgi:hypothetical protein